MTTQMTTLLERLGFKHIKQPKLVSNSKGKTRIVHYNIPIVTYLFNRMQVGMFKVYNKIFGPIRSYRCRIEGVTVKNTLFTFLEIKKIFERHKFKKKVEVLNKQGQVIFTWNKVKQKE